MHPETLEMGKTHPQWAKKYETISTLMDNHFAELRSLYLKVLMMRYETSLLALKHLKTNKLLQQIKEEAEGIEFQQNEETVQNEEM